MVWSRWRHTGPVKAEPDELQRSGAKELAQPRAILSIHRERIHGLRLESGYGAEQFAVLIDRVIENLAEYVYTLPATRVENHSESSGLLRLAIECAVMTFRRADGKFLAGPVHTDVRNRERERVWRYALFVAALLHPVGRCATSVHVSSGDPARVWNAYENGLWRWVLQVGAQELNLEWRDATDGRPEFASGIWIASRLIPAEALSYMSGAGGAVLEMLVSVLGGLRTGRLAEIAEEARQAVVNQDLLRMGRAQGGGASGISVQHYLVDAVRSLVREKWTLNVPGGRLWATREGVFLLWRGAVADIAIKLRAAGVTQAPQDPDTLAELLLQHGVLVPNADSVGAIRHYYRIVPQLRGAPKQPIEVVRLADAAGVGLSLEGVELLEAEVLPSTPHILGSNAAGVAVQGLGRASEVRRAPTSPATKAVGSLRPTPASRGASVRPSSLELPFAAPVQNSGRSPAATSTDTTSRPLEPELSTTAGKSKGPTPAIVPGISEVSDPTTVGELALEPTRSEVQPESLPAVDPSRLVQSQSALERLAQFGEAGRTLRALGERLLQQPRMPGVLRTEDGIALAYPQAIVALGQDAQTFLSACESQGLLVRDKAFGGRLVREARPSEAEFPSHYVVLSQRVSRYLSLQAVTSDGNAKL